MGVSFAGELNLQTNAQKPMNVSEVNIIDKLNKQVAVLNKEVDLLKKKVEKLESYRPEGFIKTKDGRYVFSANGARFEVGTKGEVRIKATNDLKLESKKTEIMANNININSSAQMNLRSAAMLNINSNLIRFNNGSRPVSFKDSIVTGITPHGPLAEGKVFQGSRSVLVP